ncbi:hypothetical protein [Tunturiibacter gelidoferens]|uniref:Uncharacterized protein n=1 Tax=Tunturiibacter gelidiferens TaxID=3069689 RepID=A0ACC5NTN5_9BACT|nr:hypothetical protein [Edaphobacter lichenicola]MBB5337835.1 hypothetical protein [Edaphobacter lichenicola]
MNKTQGITASAIVAAGLLMRTAGPVPKTPVLTGASASHVAGSETRSINNEGPWLASCQYWEPARRSVRESQDRSPTISISIQEKGTRIASRVIGSSESESSDCPVAKTDRYTRWGIPPASDSLQPKLSAVIAAVPDPAHTHLALEFDRDIDALVQAAGDNGYVPSYYWLPWRVRAGTYPAEELISREGLKHDATRERQPGLIVFKRVPERPDEPGYPRSSFSRVIYMFLVGDTPTLGMDGSQLKNAFQYETDLYNIDKKTTFSMKAVDELAIIGPDSSGSAASLREAIEAASTDAKSIVRKLEVNIAGSTSTDLANDLLNRRSRPSYHSLPGVNYISFGENSRLEINQLLSRISCSGYHLERVALLWEDSTVYGESGALDKRLQSNLESKSDPSCMQLNNSTNGTPVIIRFPREISLLRNAHTDSDEQQDAQSKSAPSPFLHLSLRDPGADDSVPQFSPEHMPLSQEAQLMAIGRQLLRNRTQFIVINASNVLDRLFLAQFLHRACPDARLIFLGGDLLLERETENAPFIGTITLSPYSLMSLTSSSSQRRGPVRAFADSETEAYFNAASYTLWDGADNEASFLHLANYSNPFQPLSSKHASLWATAIGTDGYYPLGIVDDCASNLPRFLPTIESAKPSYTDPKPCVEQDRNASHPSASARDGIFRRLAQLVSFSDPRYQRKPYRYPAQSWQVLCVLIGLLCILHAFAISFPNYWSPMTRDLAIAEGDQRHRRSMYIYIGTTMLFCMAFVTAYPVFPSFRFLHPNWHTVFYSAWALGAGFAALIATWRKTHSYLGWQNMTEKVKAEKHWVERNRIRLDENAVFLFNVAATFALILIPGVWVWICQTEVVNGTHSYVGPFFSYRCLHPGSGVSPLVPVLLILCGWYLWSVFQALRLRFSDGNRPRLPGRVAGRGPWQLFVSDADISRCCGVPDSCLTSNITCLLITREALRRCFPSTKWWPTLCLVGVYLSMFCAFIFGLKLESFDRFLWQPGFGPTEYEFLTSALAFPLIVIAVAGWLRVILIWGSLKRGLLEPLEQFPIRYAFTRLKGVGWMNMMRKGGLLEHWRDMARSTESMRQMVNDPELLNGFYPGHEDEKEKVQKVQKELDAWIANILSAIGEKRADSPARLQTSDRVGLQCMRQIEGCYAAFGEALLAGILIPYWEGTRIGLVEREDFGELPIKAQSLPKDEGVSRSQTSLQLLASSVADEPMYIRVAEEFLAIRYVSLIRAVLVNLRYLLIFVSAVFVLTVVAWNSYPFEPRQWIDEAFTGLLALLGTGIVCVFAQMHRNPILSRITDTNANELGIDFYLRVVTSAQYRFSHGWPISSRTWVAVCTSSFSQALALSSRCFQMRAFL